MYRSVDAKPLYIFFSADAGGWAGVGSRDGIELKRPLPRDSMKKFAMPTRKAALKLGFETA